MKSEGLSILVVDDEQLACDRLCQLLEKNTEMIISSIEVCVDSSKALRKIEEKTIDVIFLDINMPGIDGLSLAKTLRTLGHQAAIVFVTAYEEFALSAFDVAACDYLTKPVRLARLVQALQKAQIEVKVKRVMGDALTAQSTALWVTEKGKQIKLSISDVRYFKAEQKYVIVKTQAKEYFLTQSLQELEDRFSGYVVRIHRNCLVIKRAIRSLELSGEDGGSGDGQSWCVHLQDIEEPLAVSRRQLAGIRLWLSQM